ncbi:sigma factor G inhibitor Gin [Clostridium grantii]|uniref:Inhibitor of sigma-G Gin n=1 Tax=Clostridium grantii DSM 8605 TaxID=1121316 RepID=A0A1M5XRW3_9CLOT|nr:sigma factor G inhibitor Gin [Clostridium grantii]SHI02284.1 Inhibitor of sigma-G Gin [Clostridium grantii DSM 8605]
MKYLNKQSCIICGKPLNDGIMINGRGICINCEKRIINSKTGTDFYDYYEKCIRRKIVHYMSKGEDFDCPDYHC